MQQIYSVSDISSYIKRKFDTDVLLNNIYVKGEVSNCKYHSSGHIYFTLKDNRSQISCVMFAGRRAGISFRLADGQSVIVFGRITVYEQGGSYQIYADEIRLDGVGRLYEEFEELKKRLGAEGLFDVSKKKPIPGYVSKVGIVTARTGAAIQDICQIAKRRNPYVSLVLYPAQVQGEGASDTIVRGIKYLDGRVDVIIVGRGGGSIEDLWAFNEEKTARAVFECKTPIISAVGHETDTTITDYVADLRAPTPSAGAELAVYDYGRFMKDLAVLHERLYDSMADRIEAVRQGIKNREALLRKNSPGHKLELKKQWIENAGSVLKRSMENVLNNKKNELKRAAVRLEGVNPVRKLESGFSYVTDEKGKNVNRIAAVKAGDRLIMHVTDGEILTTVNEVKEGYGGKKANQRSES
ncbi:MAG: exodeoxyribonuclease VII large subunit [Lachnospiraceae bacterium]|nr:exodeoxyribonuclease VII large subunit [Lachnospiraceae bacterium]